MTKVYDYLEEFTAKLMEQLINDDARWGDEWLKRTRKGQEERIGKRIAEYFDEFKNDGVPVPWLKIAGEALIGWIREIGAPELWEE